MIPGKCSHNISFAAASYGCRIVEATGVILALMIDLNQHSSLGSALREALDKFADEICLIEADRERENHRWTYRQFKEMALPLAKFLQDRGFAAGSRAAIIMTNQSRWPTSAYAIF